MYLYFHQWRTISEFTFDEISLDETDPGLTFSITDGAGRFFGRTYDSKWRGNRIIMPVTGDKRTKIEISGDFKVVHGQEHYLVALWGQTKDNRTGFGPLCMFYEEINNKGKVAIQTRWLSLPSKLIEGEGK